VLAQAGSEPSLLLPIEARWADKELKIITAEDEDRRVKEEARKIIAEAREQGRSAEVAKALEKARSADLPRQEICEVELELRSLKKKEQKEKAEKEAWEEVSKAMAAGDVEALYAVLTRVEGLLPAEKVQAVHRKMPGMKARAEMRKELNAAVRNPSDIQQLRHLVFAAKRSTLPPEEVREAEMVLKRAEMARKSQIAAAKEAPPAAVTSPSGHAPAVPSNPPVERAEKPAEKPKENPPTPQAPAKQPRTDLERAVASGDQSRIRTAISDLKTTGTPRHEINYLHMRAMAEFGSGA